MIEKDEIQEQEIDYQGGSESSGGGGTGGQGMPQPQPQPSDEKNSEPKPKPEENGEQQEEQQEDEGQKEQQQEQEDDDDSDNQKEDDDNSDSLKQVHTLNFIDKNFSGIDSNFMFAYKYVFGQTFADVFGELLAFSEKNEGGYVFSEEKIRAGSMLTIEQYIQMDKDCLKMVVLKIKNNPDHFGENGVQRFSYDKLSSLLDSCLPPSNHTILIKTSSNLKPKFTIFYIGGNKYGMIDYDYHSEGQAISDSLVFERDDETKQLIPIKFFDKIRPSNPDGKEYLKTGSFYLLINIVSLFDKKNKSYLGIEQNPTPFWSFTSFIELYNSI